MFNDSEFVKLVDEEGTKVSDLVHTMVFPDGVAEEGFLHIVLIKPLGIEAVHQVGIVEKHTRWLLWEVVAASIDHVHKTSIHQILNVVHHRGSTHAQLLSQLTHVWHCAATHGEQVEQLLDFRQIFQLDLLHQQNIHLNHHVHRFEQILAVSLLFKEERIETMVQIVLEIVAWIHVLHDGRCYFLMVLDDFIQCVRTEVLPSL